MKIIDIINGAWAIRPDKLETIRAIYNARITGESIDLAKVEASVGRPLENQPVAFDVIDGVAVISAHGVLAKRANMFHAISGGASMEIIGSRIAEAANSADVRAILLDIDSPGGTVDGTQALAQIVRDAAGQKPVVAWCGGEMASAAYWFGSAADEVVVENQTTTLGSIGVVASHRDCSEAEARAGIKVTELTAGKYKRIASEHAPLSDEGRATIQAHIDQLYTIFVDDVAAHRGVTAQQVLEQMADGRIFLGDESVTRGLADRSASLEETISKMAAGEWPVRRRSNPATQSAVNPGGTQSTSEVKTMDIQTLKKDHPELAAALVAEGATAERQRIMDVEAASLRGHEALIQTLKFDGKTTGGEAAQQVLAAENAKLARIKALKAEDDQPPVEQDPIDSVKEEEPEAEEDDEENPVEEQAAAEFKKNKALRAEFGDLATYTAFRKAEATGRVRIQRAC